MSEHEQELTSAKQHESQPENEKSEQPRPRIWLGVLAAYNAGQLEGEWLDATADEEDLRQAAERIVAASHVPGAEEWAILDHEGFGGLRLDEHEDLALVARIGRGLVQHGPAFAAWAEWCDNDPELLEQFSEAYLGRFEDRAAFAQGLLDDLGLTRALATGVADWLQGYVTWDLAGIANELEISGDIYFTDAEGGGVWAFDARR